MSRPLTRLVNSDTEVYAAEDDEFLRACEAYRARHKIRFLHATDYRRVLLEMGYAKPEPKGESC
jgi:hypothetical protein